MAAVGFSLSVLTLVVHAYWETRPKKKLLAGRFTLSDRDPRITLTYQTDSGGIGGNEYFTLRNGGGVDAHNVQIKELYLKNFFLRFTCVPILGSNGAETQVQAEIFDRNNRSLSKNVGMALEEDWFDFETKLEDIKAHNGAVPYEGQITCDDHCGGRFLTEFTLAYTIGAQTAQIGNFRFRRV